LFKLVREEDLRQIRRALLSVSDKTGLVEFALFLHGHQVELISTGGTARLLRDSGIPVIEAGDYTGFPEILDGRVKTLHPKIHGGLLAIRDRASHQSQAQEHGIKEIDLVVANLYPFREVAARDGVPFEEVLEQIDIGGPSMIRSAAKNHAFVAVITDPLDYGWVRQELESNQCGLGAKTRFLLAQKAFGCTAAYDGAIAAYLANRARSDSGEGPSGNPLPAVDILPLEKLRDLRYGENPHQRGALYRGAGPAQGGIAGADVLHGKELSYNNLLDADAAWNLVLEFDLPAAAVIKHANPSGAAQNDDLKLAYIHARDCDPVSAYGSVVAFNRAVDAEAAQELTSTFVEVLVAPGYTDDALTILKQRKNLRILLVRSGEPAALQRRQISGGFLVQDKDVRRTRREDLRTVSKRPPTNDELEAMLFGWRVVKHVKSNAIVFSTRGCTLGIGAGQMSRVDSVRWGAQRATLPLQGCAMASDAFFPFADGIAIAAKYGATAIIQPGGSVRDAEVIEAADAHGMSMVFTGIRHFKH
jgi:phosphoribosylaminoimidazolecarboxamide formyltransferase / IMP cyclohydrolase